MKKVFMLIVGCIIKVLKHYNIKEQRQTEIVLFPRVVDAMNCSGSISVHPEQVASMFPSNH